MRLSTFFTFLLITTISRTYSQTDTTSSLDILYKQAHDKPKEKEPRKFGFTVFGGLGKGGNDLVSGLGAGGSVRAHYRFHTLNLYASNTDRLEYHGAESSSSTLHSSNYGFTYGVGAYEKNVSASIGAGLGYSFVTMSTGGGNSYKEHNYQKYGACIGGQFSVHGKYFGIGVQMYYNLTNSGNNYTILGGLEIGLN